MKASSAPVPNFFRHAMTGDWAEKDERFVKLPEDDARVFEVYVNLVYTGKITTQHHTSGEESTTVALEAEYESLSQLYVLCEKLQDTAAKNSIIQAIVAVAGDTTNAGGWVVPSTLAINTIYAGTLNGSSARRLLVDLYSATAEKHFARVSDKLPRDFLVDVAVCWCGQLRRSHKANKAQKARMSQGAGYLEEIEVHDTQTRV
ncbi:hypothetical protein CC80DRAFT_252780 [Byssothecium circinans]|uniref:BTB domain-containing protein n=1 Tax=Byssothecium circinans TaxID=147558 RepID=A0A6A5TC57_9PLEO|nr:hypothetical protein CC80DRAFT_252780 [Byssothecium circinans]